jgi:hypothetical protein
MINEWYENIISNNMEFNDKTFYMDITDKVEEIYVNNPKNKFYQCYYGRYLKYSKNPENMRGYLKLVQSSNEYINEILAFEGRAIDEIAYMESIFEFEFYWHPRLNVGVLCNSGGFFHDYVYDRYDHEDILEYESAIKPFFEEGRFPQYSTSIVSDVSAVSAVSTTS